MSHRNFSNDKNSNISNNLINFFDMFNLDDVTKNLKIKWKPKDYP